MSAPMNSMSTVKCLEESDCICEIEATVTTGFEQFAMEEAIEKLNAEVNPTRGRIIMKVPMNNVKKVLELGCVDNCYVLMTRVKDFQFSDDELESMAALRELVKDIDWEMGLKAWHQVFTFKNLIKTKPDVIPDKLGEPVLSSRIHKPKPGDNGGKKSKREKRRERKEKNMAERKKKYQQNIQGSDNSVLVKDDEKIENESTPDKVLDSGLGTNEELGKALGEQTKTEEASDVNIMDEEKPESVSESEPASKKARLTEYNPDNPAFRVTCHRSGDNHSFDSMGAASNFGGAIYNYFKWNVSMKEFDIEVMLYIEDSDVRVGLALTKQSLHRRNTTAFGPTTLRPTIAYNMLRMCKIKPGEVICDPMCGSGVIPIQSALDWPESIHLCGEIVKKGLDRTAENLNYVNNIQAEKDKPNIQVDALRWNACNLPLRDSCVDVFITDLPFGIRMGSKFENWTLYPKALQEMSRVTTPKTGRVCLLTQDKKCINKAMQLVSKYWKRSNTVGINMGGLSACVYMMYRNNEIFDESQPLVIPSREDKLSNERMKKTVSENTESG